MAKDTKKTKADDIPECPYGARCYRKNPQHLLEYSHPKKSKTDDPSDGSNTDAVDGPSSKSPSKTDDSSLPPCKYGASCYRKNLMHFAEYSHPTKAAGKDDSDTDELSDDDDTVRFNIVYHFYRMICIQELQCFNEFVLYKYTTSVSLQIWLAENWTRHASYISIGSVRWH